MNKNHLIIDINLSAVCFTKLQGDFVVGTHEFYFTDKQDYRYKEQLEEMWAKTGWKELDFDEMSLSWSDRKFSLVPVNVFSETDKDVLFNLCYGSVDPSAVIDYNRLPLQGIVNVFAIPLWVKSFFVVRFPRIILQHETTYLMRGFFSGSTLKLKANILLHHDHFTLTFVKNNAILFCSSFEYSSIEDIVYYFSFALQQLGLQDEKVELELVNAAGSEVELVTLEQLLLRLHTSNLTIKAGVNTLIKYHQLCV